MNNTVKKILSFFMTVAMVAALGCTAFAADINTNGGNGTTPVKLSSTDDGTLDGNPAATALSVTIPTSLPVAVDTSGNTTTATTAKITNNSYGAVRVKSATISCSNDWKLITFGDKNTLASEKVDSNKIGFAMTIGEGDQVKTSGTDNEQVLISSPVTGCYMSGSGDTNNNSVAINYKAIVTPISKAITDSEVASIVFVVEFDTVD